MIAVKFDHFHVVFDELFINIYGAGRFYAIKSGIYELDWLVRTFPDLGHVSKQLIALSDHELPHALGSRKIETLKLLLERLSPFNFSFYCTDDWKQYMNNLPDDKHIVGKLFTRRIERENLNLRTRLK